jgi:hypothetical protein
VILIYGSKNFKVVISHLDEKSVEDQATSLVYPNFLILMNSLVMTRDGMMMNKSG